MKPGTMIIAWFTFAALVVFGMVFLFMSCMGTKGDNCWPIAAFVSLLLAGVLAGRLSSEEVK